MDTSTGLMTAWSYGLTAFVYAVFALYLSVRWQTALRHGALLVAVLLSTLWGIAGLLFAVTGQNVFLAANLIADMLRFAGWCFFILLLQRADDDGPRPRRVSWQAVVTLLLLGVGIGAQTMVSRGIDFVWPPQRLALFDTLASTVFMLVLIEQLYRNVAQDSRWSIKPMCLGLSGAVLFDVYLYSDALLFNRIDVDAFSIRGFVHALVVPLVAVSTARSHDWKSRITLSQRIALQSISLVVVGGYLLFMAAAAYYVRYFGGEWGRSFQLALAFAALLLLVVLGFSGSMRAKLRVLISKNFFSYRYDYREEWLRFTNTLSSQNGSSEMGRHVIKGLADMVESPGGALWLKEPNGRFFAQAACWNMPASVATEDADSPLCRFLLDSGWVIDLEEYRSKPGRYDHLVLPEWLGNVANAWLLIPLCTGKQMSGFVVLATARTRIDLNWEINDLLKTAGQQAGAFLGQMRATEALLEARKFDAFNRMSAFVVHDLKNIVAQLSLMLKNAERHRGNQEFQRDMLTTIEHAVDRMRRLMMQLSEGATPVDSARGIDLADVIRRIQTAKANQGRSLDVELLDKVIAKGHEDRVERVIGHIVQNALDATEKGGQVKIRLGRQAQKALIEVDDTGHGMSPEFLRERLFKPFQTTKPEGMGIGAYESFQYVHELGGTVSVDSQINVGTQVSVLLPIFDAGNGTDARPSIKETP